MEESKSYIDEDGDTIWYLPSKGDSYWHRLDGPAMIKPNGSKSWFVNDKLHRIDGPAIEWVDGYKKWCITNTIMDTEEVEAWVLENDLSVPFDESAQMAFILRFL